MEQLKKKLKTDEDLAWVDHSKTLDEQDIHEQDIVLLRRRFFYSDQNIDTRDPIQLGLLFVQTRDAILSGTHPVHLDGACKFAGLQAQAQLGDYVEGKTSRPGYLQLRDYLPAEYAKQKHIERKIFAEHKKYIGLSELEAKAKYVSEARSLPTYGVTFFLVKEKLVGKNKLVPRLLGITKDCVMRVDADTKGILKTWPLTTVKRWAPSMNSLTLDFGDYSDSYYSVQTSEGEQISQLIAGYIDIIVKRRKAKDHFGIEGDEGATMVEDSVAPSRATIIQNQPALAQAPPVPEPAELELVSTVGPNVQKLLRTQEPHVDPAEFRPAMEIEGRAEIGYESRPPTQYLTNYELNLPQRDLQDRLEQAQDAVEEAQKVLDRPQQQSSAMSQDRRELEQKQRKLSNQFAEINAATAQLVSLSAIPEDELNYPALNRAVDTVASNLPNLAKDVKLVAASMDDHESGEQLIDAARRLCKAFSDLLNAAEPGPTVPRQSLISAASRVGDATQALLYTINGASSQLDEDELEAERERADLLLALAKTVASSAAALVLKAKDVASTCRNEELQNLVIGSATQCALATSQMVATAKIVAPTISDPNCKRKLLDACREVRRAVEGIQESFRQAIHDEQLLCRLDETVHRVQSALDELTEHVQSIRPHRSHVVSSTSGSTTTLHRIQQDQREQLEAATSGRRQSTEENPNKSELVNQARTLARATAQLIQDIRPQDGPDGATQAAYQIPVQHEQSRQRQQPQPQPPQHNQPQEQHQQHQQTTTTITTTLYDEHNQRGQNERPVSMYDSETSLIMAPSQLGAQTSQQREESRETTTHYTSSTSASQLEQPRQGSEPELAISGIVGDLETTIVFASAGTLRAQDENDSYLAHRENVLSCAKALVEDTRPLVASAASDRSQLARAAQESVFTMSRLAETVKSSAASLGPNNAESQVSLIRSVKDVAVSLADLIESTKSALGCDPNSQRLIQVKDSAKGMVGSVTSLLRTVKSVEDEQQRGVRALEAALEAIEQDLVAYESECNSASGLASADSSPRQRLAAAEELLRASRPVTMATAKSVHAASSSAQDDAIVAANMGRKALSDLLQTSRLACQEAQSYELRSRIQTGARNCALQFKRLLELLQSIFQHPAVASANPEIKQQLIGQSKSIAQSVTELAACSELLKSSAETGAGQGGQQDPTVIAESELLGAASSIDAAAKKLENLKPRVTSIKVS